MLSPAEVLATAKKGQEEASEAATRALGAPIKVAAQSATAFLPDLLGDNYNGPGLAVVLHTEIGGVVLLLPEAGGVLPGWYADPNESQASQLATLAQEWGMTLWPEAATPSDFAAAKVLNLREALSAGIVGPDAGALSLTISAGEIASPMLLVWPVENPDAVLRSSAPPKGAQAASTDSNSKQTGYDNFEEGVAHLPRYARSLLKVRVPLRVTLARSRQPIARILSMDQGSILNFSKSCDEPLLLEVGEEQIAEGEVIRIGDKFGVRVTGMVLPSERFLSLQGEAKSAARR